MAEAFGLVTGAAQLYVLAVEVIKLTTELRNELANGPRRIREHLKSLDSTISILQIIESDPESLNTKILYFVQAVKDRVEPLLALLQSNHESLSCRSFKRVLGAFKAVKSAGKLDDEFAALDREKANLHLYISARSDSALQQLISVTTMTSNKRSNDVLPDNDAQRLFECDDVGAVVRYTGVTPKSELQRLEHTDWNSSANQKSSEGAEAGSDSHTGGGHDVATKDNYGNYATKKVGDIITLTNTPNYTPQSHKIRSEDTFGHNANTHIGNEITYTNTSIQKEAESENKRNRIFLNLVRNK